MTEMNDVAVYQTARLTNMYMSIGNYIYIYTYTYIYIYIKRREIKLKILQL
jgi:hypothetical protein